MKTLLSIIILLSACSSTPDIPDQSKERTYRSTYAGGTEETKIEKKIEPAMENKENALPNAIGPVALVDDTPIPAAIYNIEMARLQKTGTPVPMIQKLKHKLIMKLVDQHLIEKAIEKSRINVPDAKVDAKLEEVRKEFEAMKGKATLESMTKQLGISASDLRKSIKQSVALESVLAKDGLIFDEKSVKTFYDENPDNFARPDQIRASHILLKVGKSAAENDWKAKEQEIKKLLKTALKKNTDFAKLAEANSEDTLSAKQGGELGGFFPKGVMVPEFENAAFDLKIGEISKPIRTQYGWHIIKLNEKRAAGPVPFKEIETKLRAQLKANGMQQYLGAYVQKLRAGSVIKIMKDNVQ